MKNIYLLLLSTILLISCQKGQEKSNLGKENASRENAIGTWKLISKTENSIDHFELHPDSTAIVYESEKDKKGIKTTWNWKPKKIKKFSFIGFEASTDVWFGINQNYFGFLISKENGEYYLGSNNFKFKKIK